MRDKVKSQAELEREWTKKGFSCGLWVDPPGQRWEDYVHDDDEVVYIMEGTMEFEIGGNKKVLNPGDEAFIPAHTKHSARNIGGTTARWGYGYRI